MSIENPAVVDLVLGEILNLLVTTRVIQMEQTAFTGTFGDQIVDRSWGGQICC